MTKYKELFSIPPNEHRRGSRVTKSTFWYELLIAVMVGLAWGFIGTMLGIVQPWASILSLLTYLTYLFFFSRRVRNNIWDNENP